VTAQTLMKTEGSSAAAGKSIGDEARGRSWWSHGHSTPREWFWRVFGIIATIAVAVVDHITGDEVNVTLFYLVPLSIASWQLSRGEAVFAAVLSALAWLLEAQLFGRVPTSRGIAFWNTSMLLGFFLTVVFILDSLKKSFAEQQRLIAELQDALANVKALRGLLPICSWCKKIRDDTGYWQAVETYVGDHSQAEFTHGICPECSAKLTDSQRTRS